MAWTYSGDPSVGDKDRYRFLIGDTNDLEPILQDGEVEFIIAEYEDHNVRLYHLYDRAADFFARQIERKVGPIYEKPIQRQWYYERKARYYKQYSYNMTAGFGQPKSTPTVFTKGMHDNV